MLFYSGVMLSAQPAALLETLQPYVWPLVISLTLTAVTTPVVRAFAVAERIMDQPDAHLKPHTLPVPYLGGLAIYVGWAVALVAMLWLSPGSTLVPESRRMLLYILIAGTVMMVTGLVDDVRTIRPRTRLLCELAAAVILIAGGIGKHVLLVFVGWIGVHPPEWVTTIASAALTVLILIGAGNATNLIDGLDGLCSGVTGIISLGFAAIAAHLAVWGYSEQGDPVRLIVAFALLGACLGFLRYNFNPARVFMGDAGSLLLGFNAAVMLLLFAERSILRWFLGACMVFALPALDTGLAIVRRWLNGRPLFVGDRSHFYDQLCDRGFSTRKTVLICYALAAALAAIGCLVLFFRLRYAAVIFLAVLVAAAWSAVHYRMLRVDPDTDR